VGAGRRYLAGEKPLEDDTLNVLSELAQGICNIDSKVESKLEVRAQGYDNVFPNGH
jgi:hypothetical protein